MEQKKTTFAAPKSRSSSVGRARPCQGRGRGSESRLLLQVNDEFEFNLKLIFIYFLLAIARVVELVDTQDLKSCNLAIVRVQLPSRVQKPRIYRGFCYYIHSNSSLIAFREYSYLLKAVKYYQVPSVSIHIDEMV